MIAIGCNCGWKSSEPSRRQADLAIDEHRRIHCPLERICSICTEVGRGALRKQLGRNAPPVFVCDRCHDEHPRSGRYNYDGSGMASRVTTGRVGPKGRSK